MALTVERALERKRGAIADGRPGGACQIDVRIEHNHEALVGITGIDRIAERDQIVGRLD